LKAQDGKQHAHDLSLGLWSSNLGLFARLIDVLFTLSFFFFFFVFLSLFLPKRYSQVNFLYNKLLFFLSSL